MSVGTHQALVYSRGAEDVFAYRRGRPVSVARFVAEAQALAALLPGKRYMLNLCADRYNFAVGFAAALLRDQISLFPPNHTPGMVAGLAADYSGVYCLSDAGHDFPGLETIAFPDSDGVMGEMEMPRIPSERIAALVFTSGSTGKPVAHPKTWGSLGCDGRAEAVALGLENRGAHALLGTVPPQHMYGLESTVMLAMQGGQILVAEKPFYPVDICAQLETLPIPRCLITTPVHLRILLEERESLPRVAFVLSATAPLAQDMAAKAEERFDAPLYEIYGCTEAGQVATRQTVKGLAWKLLPDVRLRQDESRVMWAHGGHVEIEVPLSDVIEPESDGTFRLIGRLSDMVNIAGKRTSLGSLNHHLNAIPGVQDGVFVLPDPAADGEHVRPMALVVAPALSARDVMMALRGVLDPVFLPRPLIFVEKLPRNETGKIPREAIRQLIARHARAVSEEGGR